MPAGRPANKIDDVLPEDWKEQIPVMMSKGYSDAEIRAEICMPNGQLSIRMWYALQERDEEFREVLKKSKELCRAWWEKQGRINLKAQVFQTGLWSMNMKNRFKWRDNPIDEEIEDYRKTLKNLADTINQLDTKAD